MATITKYTQKRFEFEIQEGNVEKPVAKKEVMMPSRSVTEEEAEAWALELDAQMKTPVVNARRDRLGLDDDEELDGPAFAMILQGLHRMQVRGCTAAEETRYIRSFGIDC